MSVLPSKKAATAFLSAGESFGECAATTPASAGAAEPFAAPAKAAGAPTSQSDIVRESGFISLIRISVIRASPDIDHFAAAIVKRPGNFSRGRKLPKPKVSVRHAGR